MKYLDLCFRKIALFFFDWRVISLVLLLGFAGICVAERNPATVPMALFIAVAMVALFTSLTARAVSSLYLSLALLTIVAFVSYAKMKWMSIAPNVVDIYYFAMNPGTLTFLFDNFLLYVIVVAFLFVAAVGGTILLGWYERSSGRNRRVAMAAFPIAIAMVVVLQPKDFQGIGDLMRFRYVTSFFTSMKYLSHLGDEILLLNQLSDENKKSSQMAANNVCRKHGSKPDILVVQAESVVPPELIYDGDDLAGLKGLFNGADNVLRPLKVETFSGGTWISTAGFATSLLISDLGWLKSYSNFVLEGQVHHSLATTLADCGYHTVYVSPLPYSFVNEGPFIESIGFETFLDQDALNAPSTHEADAFYYERALDFMEESRLKDDRPIFMVILTMSAHSPWDYRMSPEMVFDGEPFSQDAALNEYFRRLAISRLDLADFTQKLKARPKGRPALVMEFGDHQPGIIRPHWVDLEGADALENPDSAAYLTYFQILSAGAQIAAPVPIFEKLDIQYLGPTLLEAAGLPLDPIYEDLLAMRDACNGSFSACDVQGRMDAHFQCRRDAYAGRECARSEAVADMIEKLRPSL